MKKKKLKGKYSLFSIAGSTLGITSKNLKNWYCMYATWVWMLGNNPYCKY